MKKMLPFLLTMTAVLLAGCSSSPAPANPPSSAESTKAAADTTGAADSASTAGETNQTRKVIVATGGSGEPYSLLGDDGKTWTGIDAEMWSEIARRTGWEVEPKQVEFSALFGELDTGRVNAAANCFATTPARMEKYITSHPYYGDAQCIIVNEDKADVNSFDQLKGLTIGVAQGQASQVSVEAMALDAIRLVGQKRAGLAMAITGYIVSIPVFSDAAFVILTPLVKAINKKTRIPLAILAVSLSSGLLATHVYVPPTPGPLAAAGLLGIDIGEAILYGAFAAVFMTAFGWIFAELYFKKKPDSFYTFREGEVPEAVGDDADDTSGLPGTLASLLPLVVPILLIISKTTWTVTNEFT